MHLFQAAWGGTFYSATFYPYALWPSWGEADTIPHPCLCHGLPYLTSTGFVVVVVAGVGGDVVVVVIAVMAGAGVTGVACCRLTPTRRELMICSSCFIDLMAAKLRAIVSTGWRQVVVVYL